MIYEAEIGGVQGFFVAPQLDKLNKLDNFPAETSEEDLGPNNPSIDKSSAKTDGPGRIRTGDLRRVKATS